MKRTAFRVLVVADLLLAYLGGPIAIFYGMVNATSKRAILGSGVFAALMIAIFASVHIFNLVAALDLDTAKQELREAQDRKRRAEERALAMEILALQVKSAFAVSRKIVEH